MKTHDQSQFKWIELVLMLAVSAAIYLPYVEQFGYYNDDWYSMYAARVAGSQVFHEIYGLDRPARAYVMIPLYELFGGNPLYYNVSAYIFRVLGAVILLWLLRLVWRGQRLETFLIAFLFLIYPGFLSMPNGIDFQSHLIAICFVFISMGWSVQALHAGDMWKRIGLWSGATLTGWAYLSQMEYYIGFEAARILVFGVFAWRANSTWKKAGWQVLYTWLPYAPVSVFYLIWRVFFFTNERAATDINLQLGSLLTTPLVTLYDWVIHFIQSFLNVTVLAWGVPLWLLSFGLDTSSSIRGIALATVIIVVTFGWLYYFAKNSRQGGEESLAPHWQKEMLLVGILWTVAGLVVVVLANRAVLIPAYARYGMVSAAGALILLVSGISALNERRLQVALLAFLFFSASMTHYANSLQQAQIAQAMRTFWWQVTWRVPQFKDGATLVVNYPNSGNREESFIWGPANQIYYPIRLVPNKIRAGIYAILLDHDAVTKILVREGQLYRKRIIVDTYKNYRNFVILTQPSPGSCVQVIDGTAPEYSRYEIDSIMVVAPYSEVEHIALNEEFRTPPGFLFGGEPPRGWCFYYEKAAYARQKGDWASVISIGNEALEKGLAPVDLIEWMPFLQAYALTDNIERLTELAPVLGVDPYISLQACHILLSLENLSSKVVETVDLHYCPE